MILSNVFFKEFPLGAVVRLIPSAIESDVKWTQFASDFFFTPTFRAKRTLQTSLT